MLSLSYSSGLKAQFDKNRHLRPITFLLFSLVTLLRSDNNLKILFITATVLISQRELEGFFYSYNM